MKSGKAIAVLLAIFLSYHYGYMAHEVDHFDDLETVQQNAKQDVIRANENVWIALSRVMQCMK